MSLLDVAILRMNTFAAVIDAFGGPGPFGSAIGIPDSHARTMKARDSIPAGRWVEVVDAATRLQVVGVTIERLAQIEAARQRKPEPVAS